MFHILMDEQEREEVERKRGRRLSPADDGDDRSVFGVEWASQDGDENEGSRKRQRTAAADSEAPADDDKKLAASDDLSALVVQTPASMMVEAAAPSAPAAAAPHGNRLANLPPLAPSRPLVVGSYYSDCTDYPTFYKKVYWGHNRVQRDRVLCDELKDCMARRNQFVRDFHITKSKVELKAGKRNEQEVRLPFPILQTIKYTNVFQLYPRIHVSTVLVLSALICFSHTLGIYQVRMDRSFGRLMDHHELYRDNDGNYVSIWSPYMGREVDEEKLEKDLLAVTGYRPYFNMYSGSDSRTYVKVIPQKKGGVISSHIKEMLITRAAEAVIARPVLLK
jgi:hypothetical protein